MVPLRHARLALECRAPGRANFGCSTKCIPDLMHIMRPGERVVGGLSENEAVFRPVWLIPRNLENALRKLKREIGQELFLGRFRQVYLLER